MEDGRLSDYPLTEHDARIGSVMLVTLVGNFLQVMTADRGPRLVAVAAADTLDDVKAKISEQHGIPTDRQRWMVADAALEDS